MILKPNHHQPVVAVLGRPHDVDLVQRRRKRLLDEHVGAGLECGERHGRVPVNAGGYRAQLQPSAVPLEHLAIIREHVAADGAELADDRLVLVGAYHRDRGQHDLAERMELPEQVVVDPAVSRDADQGDARGVGFWFGWHFRERGIFQTSERTVSQKPPRIAPETAQQIRKPRASSRVQRQNSHCERGKSLR